MTGYKYVCLLRSRIVFKVLAQHTKMRKILNNSFLEICIWVQSTHISKFIQKKKSLKPYQNLFIKIKQTKTILEPKLSFTVKENYIGSGVSEIIQYTLTYLYSSIF